MQLSKIQQKYIYAIIEHSEAVCVDTNKTNFSRAELRLISMSLKGKKWIPNWITHDLSRRVGRGVFSIPEVMDTINPQAVSPGHGNEGDNLADSAPTVDTENDVPAYTVELLEDDPQSNVNQQAMQEMPL